MLIKRAVLDRIVAGEIDTVFRRQRRPTVRSGGTLRTPVGMLDIVLVEQIELGDITVADARRAGYDDIESVAADLVAKPDGVVLRVRVRFGGADPQLGLRERADLTAAEMADLVARLDRYDAASPAGPWTRGFLRSIGEHPHVRAPDLAVAIGWEIAPFKANVRKLKSLGLTISHSPGYELSPRGRAFLDREASAPNHRG